VDVRLSAAEILAGPGRIECSRLRANISSRQCAVNQAQARVDPWGPLAPCRKCDQADRSREKLRPRKLLGNWGEEVRTREYLAYVGKGEQVENMCHQNPAAPEKKRLGWKRQTEELRDCSVRAGWSSRRIDRRLRELNEKASRAVREAILAAWRDELEDGT